LSRIVYFFFFFYKKLFNIEKSEKVKLKSWKGKSSFTVKPIPLNNPSRFVVITYQKEDKDSTPREVRREITRQEVNRVLYFINQLNEGKKIPTRKIGELVYKKRWEDVFSNRFQHTQLNLILRLLDYYQITRYRSRYSTVLRSVREIQEVL